MTNSCSFAEREREGERKREREREGELSHVAQSIFM